MRRVLFVMMLLVGCVGGAAAQTPAPAAPAPAGHWVGSIQAGPGLDVEVDIAREGTGWRGTISIPMQSVKGLPLSDVAVKDSTVSFAMKGAPGDPRYSGELGKDGKTITGTFSQGGGSVPLTLTWKGEPQFEKAVKNAAIPTSLLGTWEGALNVNTTTLRLRLVLSNGADGATGTLISLDQNNAEIPISAIAAEGAHLKVTAPMIGGAFEGDLKGDELTGTWSQGPGSLPLTLKKKP
jgi:hypothetical protein